MGRSATHNIISRKNFLTKANICSYNRIYSFWVSYMGMYDEETVCSQGYSVSGLVLVSTGVWKSEKPSVAGHYVKSSN